VLEEERGRMREEERVEQCRRRKGAGNGTRIGLDCVGGGEEQET